MLSEQGTQGTMGATHCSHNTHFDILGFCFFFFLPQTDQKVHLKNPDTHNRIMCTTRFYLNKNQLLLFIPSDASFGGQRIGVKIQFHLSCTAPPDRKSLQCFATTPHIAAWESPASVPSGNTGLAVSSGEPMLLACKLNTVFAVKQRYSGDRCEVQGECGMADEAAVGCRVVIKIAPIHVFYLCFWARCHIVLCRIR